MKTLRYEKFTERHIEAYYAWRNDPEVARYDQSVFLRPMSFEEVAQWCERMIEGPSFMVYAEDTPIGTCAFMNLDERNRHAELALVIGDKRYWNQGYGSRIMDQLLEWGFEGMNLNRLYLHVFANNPRAIRMYEKKGFVAEGRLRSMVYRDGQYHDLLCYGMMKDEWRSAQNPDA